MSSHNAEDRTLRVLERALARGSRSADILGGEVELEREADVLSEQLAELATASPTAPPPALRGRVLAATQPGDRLGGFAERLGELFDWPVERARALLDECASQVTEEPRTPDWIDGPGAGIRIRPVEAGPRHGAAPAGMVWCAPGSVFPEHSHHGPEWALVLGGEAYDSSGAHWSVGDLVAQDAGSHHRFEIPEDGPPLLAAVVVRQGFELH